MSHAERLAAIDGYTAPRWFKTVTKETFDANNYFAMQYSRDSARALRLWKESAAVPLPVMVRYLIEYMAMDLSEEFARVRVPTKVLVPSFDSTILADKRQAYVKTLFIDSWDSVHVRNPGIAIQHVPDSRIFITDDQPAFVQQAIDDVATNRITRPRASRFFAGATPATPSYRSRQ